MPALIEQYPPRGRQREKEGLPASSAPTLLHDLQGREYYPHALREYGRFHRSPWLGAAPHYFLQLFFCRNRRREQRIEANNYDGVGTMYGQKSVENRWIGMNAHDTPTGDARWTRRSSTMGSPPRSWTGTVPLFRRVTPVMSRASRQAPHELSTQDVRSHGLAVMGHIHFTRVEE